jgi:hypothetical protein
VTKNDTNANPEIFVWPTVVASEFNVALSNGQFYDLVLYSTAGKVIKEKHECQFKTTMNISDYPGGVYILIVSGNNFRKSVKLIRD